jgi:hypothetical protein
MVGRNVNNSPGSTSESLTDDQVETYWKALPQPVKDYLKYDAVADWSARSVYNLYRKFKGETLAALKAAESMDCVKVYDERHPQLLPRQPRR